MCHPCPLSSNFPSFSNIHVGISKYPRGESVVPDIVPFWYVVGSKLLQRADVKFAQLLGYWLLRIPVGMHLTYNDNVGTHDLCVRPR